MKVYKGIIWLGFTMEAWGEDKDHAIENMYARRAQECPNCIENADTDDITDVERVVR